MLLTDALELMSKPVFDEETGNMLVSARSARTGIQLYRGAEVGKPEMEWVSVYRDPADVFSKDSLESYTAIPVTMGHPRDPVTKDTWRDVAIGETDGAIKDGDFIRVPFTVRHGRAIQQIKDGTVQISMGYSGSILWGDGLTPEGEKYDAKVTDLRMNHLAIVSQARGGDKLRIGDDAENPPKKEPSMKKLIFDGIAVSIDDHDAVESGVKKLEANLADAQAATAAAITAKDAAEAKAAADATTATQALADAQAQVATLTAEKATLSQELADARDPAKLRDAAAEYGKVVEKAKAMGVTVADADSLATVKRNAVNAKLGDVAKDWTDAQVDVSFATLSVAAPSQQSDPYRLAMGDRKSVDMQDDATASRNARLEMIKGYAREDAE